MARPKLKLEVHSNNTEDYKTFADKKFSTHSLNGFRPMTEPQKQFFRSFSSGVRVIAQIGSAGTGKTACAMYAALYETFDKSTPIDKIIIARSSVQTREIGHLPGTEEEKNSVYEQPYLDLCSQLLKFKDKETTYKNLKAKNIIEFHNTSFLRGITWDDSIVILDEAQSATYHELVSVFTRLGHRSRFIMCADSKQNDLTRKGDVSGLAKFLTVLERMSKNVDIIRYYPQDCVRAELVKQFLIAEEELGY